MVRVLIELTFRLKISLLVFLLIFFEFTAGHSQSKTMAEFRISPVSESLVSSDHTSEGILVTLSNGNVEHYFRLDPGEMGNHVSNTSTIAKRTSQDNGNSWSKPEVIYNSPFDDRNIRGGRTSTSNTLLFFRRFDAIAYKTVHMNYLQSNDNGRSWSDPILIEKQGLCDNCTYSDYFIELRKNFYMLSQTIVGYTELHFFRMKENKVVWEKGKTIIDYSGKMNIDEPRFANLGRGKIIGLFRDDGGINYYQSVSEDYGKTWSVPERTNICDGLFSPNPEVFYDKKHDLLFVVGTDRGKPYEKDAIWIYSNNPDDVFKNPKGYTLVKKNERPKPNTYQLYGYPASTQLKNGDYLIVFTESFLKENGREGANFFQFTINFN
jgi:hypothetical protein